MNWRRLLLLVACGSVRTGLAAEYQLGAGILLASQPHYRAAEQSNMLVLPVPFFTYQSERLTIDRQGATGLLAEGDGWQLNVSLAGALPVDSADNRLRQGMPSLAWVGELGPALDIQLNDTWSIRLPVRQAVAGNLRRQHAIGQRFEPELRYSTDLTSRWQWQCSTSLAWSSRKYHQYFYGVNDQDHTAQRPVYDAKAGYSGWRLSQGVVYQQQQWWFGGYIRYDNSANTAYADSPLFGKTHQLSAGLVLVRIFDQGRW